MPNGCKPKCLADGQSSIPKVPKPTECNLGEHKKEMPREETFGHPSNSLDQERRGAAFKGLSLGKIATKTIVTSGTAAESI